MQNVPQVNVLTNFKKLEDCEDKFHENLDRIKDSDKKGSIKTDQDRKKYLEILDNANNLKSYWFCNEIIFYRK
tara:strand:- start:112 stop:330 length:219 start_codon:yes stop_codon:yes gene_type:complete